MKIINIFTTTIIFYFQVSHLVMILICQGYGLEKISLQLNTERYIPSEPKTDTIFQDMNMTKIAL